MNVVEVNGLSKAFRIGGVEAESETLIEQLFATLRRPISAYANLKSLTTQNDEKTLHWALKDISFSVSSGEVVGFVGGNGAGKSTLLKILCNITKPTSGEVRMTGKVASLLEVGTGFHPELTGRENIFLNGSILGLKKDDIRANLDSIVDFSGVSKFIDTPVKRYSSGMKVRLAFSVASFLRSDVLIVDEVLAVGDAAFQERCLGRMKEVANGGRTVLFVSHNMAAVSSLCTRAILLESGKTTLDDNPSVIVQEYISSIYGEAKGEVDCKGLPRNSTKFLYEGAEIRSIFLPGNRVGLVGVGESLEVVIRVRLEIDCLNVVVGLYISRPDVGLLSFIHMAQTEEGAVALKSGVYDFRVLVPRLNFMPGNYVLGAVVTLDSQAKGDLLVEALPICVTQHEVVANDGLWLDSVTRIISRMDSRWDVEHVD